MTGLRLAAGLVLSVFLGRTLARYLFALPVEAAWFTGTIQATLRAAGRFDLTDADDVQTIGSAVLLIACIAGVGSLLFVLDKIVFGRARP